MCVFDIHTGVGPTAKQHSPENSHILTVDHDIQRQKLQGVLSYNKSLQSRISKGGNGRVYHVT